MNELFRLSPTLQRVAADVITAADLRARLAGGQQLRIKYGVDVTAPFLHIGHGVNLWAMRELQQAGHKVVLLIGDFTTRIGDPTGRSATRPLIPDEQIDRDAEAFADQASRILLTDPAVFELRRNSEWWGPMRLEMFVGLLSEVTHARLTQRDMFAARINSGAEIRMHELLYPVLQGYDSCALESDLTIVGTDQHFNELMGRFLAERLGRPPQVVVTTEITPGTDGRAKQSKSLGNYIAISDSPRDMFGKSMKLPDHLVTTYLRHYTMVPVAEIEALDTALTAGEVSPMTAKRLLGRELVGRYYTAEVAAREDEWFSRVFSARSLPDDIPVVTVDDPNATLLDLLGRCQPGKSRTELRRLIADGSVRLDGQRKLTDLDQRHPVSSGDAIRVGKRQWFRVEFGTRKPGAPNSGAQ
ncbi:MAG TPA: tyrosine--tRNA ligase [Streptosporangiaceae bacterium]|nr:tyrosine--tRNA ligase [Streptosporangiaceae bacterium]